jgi:hypothetical protein
VFACHVLFLLLSPYCDSMVVLAAVLMRAFAVVNDSLLQTSRLWTRTPRT